VPSEGGRLKGGDDVPHNGLERATQLRRGVEDSVEGVERQFNDHLQRMCAREREATIVGHMEATGRRVHARVRHTGTRLLRPI
jgi:hypothetical protein